MCQIKDNNNIFSYYKGNILKEVKKDICDKLNIDYKRITLYPIIDNNLSLDPALDALSVNEDDLFYLNLTKLEIGQGLGQGHRQNVTDITKNLQNVNEELINNKKNFSKKCREEFRVLERTILSPIDSNNLVEQNFVFI